MATRPNRLIHNITLKFLKNFSQEGNYSLFKATVRTAKHHSLLSSQYVKLERHMKICPTFKEDFQRYIWQKHLRKQNNKKEKETVQKSDTQALGLQLTTILIVD